MPEAKKTDDVGPSSTADPSGLEVIVTGADSVHEIRLVGELDMATAPLLREELVRLISGGATLITVDMGDLAFIDSTGLSVLITAVKRLRLHEGDMALRSPTASTRKVLEITGLDEVFSIS